MRGGEGLFNTAVYLAAAMAASYLDCLESLSSFVSSDDFTTGYLILKLINFIAGRHQYKDALSVAIRNQIEAVERSLNEEVKDREEEPRNQPINVAPKKTSKMTCTTIDMAMVSASGQCSICLQEFQEGQEGKFIPQCHHLFHPVCIDNWLRTHSSCPLCRSHVF